MIYCLAYTGHCFELQGIVQGNVGRGKTKVRHPFGASDLCVGTRLRGCPPGLVGLGLCGKLFESFLVDCFDFGIIDGLGCLFIVVGTEDNYSVSCNEEGI